MKTAYLDLAAGLRCRDMYYQRLRFSYRYILCLCGGQLERQEILGWPPLRRYKKEYQQQKNHIYHGCHTQSERMPPTTV
jgi:hypothetical protein